MPSPEPTRMRLPGFLAGFALGGFMDGILLHQILQWHHLLSGVTDAADLRFQMFWDGVFHAAHYALAAIALVLFATRRHDAAAPGAGRALAAATLAGFGAWHLLDAVLNHWILGLHRIRQDAPDPLFWDLVFFALGVVTLLAGLVIARSGGGQSGRAGTATLAAVLLLAVPVAALPPREPDIGAQLAAGGLLPAFCANWTRYEAR